MAKNNPIMYVLDFSKAKIIETTQAEYDLSLATQKQFSLPVFEKQEIINKFFAILKNGIKITLKNENTQLA